MGKTLRDEDLKLNMIVNGKQGMKELGDVEQATRNLTTQNKDLRAEKVRLESQNKKETAEYKRVTQQIKLNNEAIKKNKARMGELRNEIGLNSLTMRQLKQRARELRLSLDNATPGTAAWKQYNSQLNQVNDRMTQLKGGAKQAGISMKSLFLAGGIAGLAAKTIGFLKDLGGEILQLAEQLQLTDKRAKIVFGISFPKVAQAADQLARKLGLTNNEFIKATTNTADLLVPLDFTRKKSAELAIELTKLSGALDEWSGGQLGAEETANILTKAMLGENEQLKQLGIAIRKDSEEFRNLVKEKLKDEAATKAQAEALATFELILKKSADAQRAFADEADNLLRKRKSFTTWWKQQKENAAGWFNDVGERLVNLGDLFEQTFNSIKGHMNTVFGTSFDVKPITDYANAILHATDGAQELTQIVERFGIETKEGARAMIQLQKNLEKTYGSDGNKIWQLYYKEQKKAAETRNRQVQEELRVQQDIRNKAATDRAVKQKEADDKLAAQKTKENERRAREEEQRIKNHQQQVMEAVDLAYQQEKNQLTQQFVNRKLTKQQYDEEMLILELAHLDAILGARMQLGIDTIDIETQILEKEKLLLEQKIKIDQDKIKSEKKVQQEKEKTAQADEARRKVEIEGYVQSGAAAIENAKTAEEAGRAILNVIRKEIKAQIAKAIARSVADALKTVPPPFNIILGVAAGAATSALFNKLVPQFGTGRYNVTGASDGKAYNNVPFTGTAQTGLYTRPALVAETGSEIIVDPKTTQNLMLNYPEVIRAINHARVPQHADGVFPANTITNNNTETKFTDPELIRAINILNTNLEKGVRAFVVYDDLRDADEEIANIENDVTA